MSGIVGIVNLDTSPVSPILLKRMTDTIAHRGPNGDGHWIEHNIGFGHRRLGVLDLAPGGQQPILSADQNLVLVFDGRIYNFREIRAELRAKGHWYQGKSDSEVVLNALVAWGVGALERFNGMFAFALWNRRERMLLLARDRFGTKPLYYMQQGSVFSFGSEQKALLTLPGIRRTVDREALLEYFTFQNLFTDRTLLKDIKLLPAGHYAALDMTRESPRVQRIQYWDFNFQEPEQPAADDEYREELHHLIRQAVNRQLVGAAEVGSYLSGGMDSGSITAIAAQSLPNMKTFTCGFDLRSASGLELAFDERSKAEAMSYLFRTEHYQMVLKAGDMERCLPKLTWHLEEPRVGQSYPNFYAAQLASKFVKVVLSGTGGDEIFGGYPWRYYRAVINNDFEDYIDKYYVFWQRLVSNRELKKLFAPIWGDVKHVWTRDIFRDVFFRRRERLDGPVDYINHSLYFEAKTFLHGLLIVEDKLGMAHGVETRFPFLDNDLVDFSMRCPVRLKLKNLAEVIRLNENEPGIKTEMYFERTRDGKRILREVMENYIPAEVAQAQKQGFSAPDASWFKGDSIDYVKSKILRRDARLYEFFDPAAVSTLVGEHLEGTHNRRLLIWSLLYFEEWLSRFIDD